MIGIYKVTSPTGRIYIGQSININNRFKQYISLKNCKSQIKLYRSFLKHGVKSHYFETIEICGIEILNERERYWQDYYKVLNGGLNCILVNGNNIKGKFSKETRLNISKALKGKCSGNKNPFYGKKHTKDVCEKISVSNSLRIVSKETRTKMSDARKNIIFSESHKKNISNSLIGKKRPNDVVCKYSLNRMKTYLDCQTGVYYRGLNEVSNIYNIPVSTLSAMFNGRLKNKTNLILC